MPQSRREQPKQITYIEIAIFIILCGLAIFINKNGILFSIRSRAIGTPAHIVVATGDTLGPMPTAFFHAFAQGGEEPTDMIAPVADDVRALKPSYIRIDHIFDYYHVVSKDNGVLSFDFSTLDGIIDTIRSLGATPVLSLSYMPVAIAKDGIITNPPDDWNDWTAVVQKTIEHISGKAGKNISGVYYEVWNEPDLESFGKWKTYGNKNYLTLYGNATHAANSARDVNNFYLGGPATTGLYKDWIVSLAKTGYRMDFISWHTYKADPKQFAEDTQSLKLWLEEYPTLRDIPVLITEYGFTGAKDKRYGSAYAASYTAAAIRQLLFSPPVGLFTFELKDGPGGQTDGWGLLPHESIGGNPRPRYFLFPLLDSMKGNVLSLTGEGTWVSGIATSRSGAIRVLLSNFRPDQDNSENVPVTFTGLDPGQYSFRQQQLLGHDVTIQVSIPQPAWQTHVYMPPNAVTLLTLTKKDGSVPQQ